MTIRNSIIHMLMGKCMLPHICLVLWHFTALVNSAILPSIVWDPRNPMFYCENLEIRVRINDRLNILCPNRAVNLAELEESIPQDNLHENCFILQPDSESQFVNCNATGGKEVVVCDQPGTLKYQTLSFKEFSGSSSALLFTGGKTYYLIGTGDGTKTKLNNSIGGSCLGLGGAKKKLKLKIRVCTNDEVNIFKNCTACTTHSCYTAGCEKYTDWIKTKTFLWNGTHCLNRETRTCNASVGFCKEPLERDVISWNNCTFPGKATCGSSMSSQPATTYSTEPTIYSSNMDNSITRATLIPTSSPQTTLSTANTEVKLMPSETSSTSLKLRVTQTIDHQGLSKSVLLTFTSVIVPRPSNCACASQTVVVKPPAAGRSQGDANNDVSAAYLVVPSIIGGIVLGIAIAVAFKFVLTNKAQRKRNRTVLRLEPVDTA